MPEIRFFDPKGLLKKKVTIELTALEMINILSALMVYNHESLAGLIKETDAQTAREFDALILKFRDLVSKVRRE